MLQQGVHPKVVQERLGHSEISLTLNTYSHVLPSMQEEAAEAVDGLITLIDVAAKKENGAMRCNVGYSKVAVKQKGPVISTGPYLVHLGLRRIPNRIYR
jgi:hypothetical protein